MFQPPFSITNSVLNKIVAITERITEISLTEKMDLHLRKENRLKSIHSSLAIEANSLTLEQVTALVNGKRVIGKPQEIKEVQNAFQAYEQIFSLNPYQVKDFLEAHRLLTQELVKRAGDFRKGDVGIYDERGNVVHMGARPQFVNSLVTDLFKWAEQADIPVLIKSSIVHYELEKIHPFEDGNGRMGRLWQNLILSLDYPIFEYLPVETMIYKHQQDYYKALADNDSSSQFIDFMLDVILETIMNSDIVSDKIAIKKLSNSELKFYQQVREYLQKYDWISSSKAQELSGKAAATVRKYFKKLVEEELVSSTGKNKARRYYLIETEKVD